jgi:histone H3/H4
VPSTLHALRALQERSANKTRTALRSAGKRKYDVHRIHGDDQVRPGSARGILRRLAKVTAKDLKKRPRDSEVLRHIGKENVRPTDNDDEDAIGLKKPRLAQDVLDEEDSLVLDKSMLPQYDDEDSELPTAPTPSILPDDGDTTNNVRIGDGDRSLTFKSIDFAKVAQEQDGDRRKSRVSFAPSVRGLGTDEVEDEDEDEDPTILTERGRRAVSEDMTGRFSRYSFGSIRMSDFGSELEVRRDSEMVKDVRKSLDARLPPPLLLESETMGLQDLEQELQVEEGPVFGDDDDAQIQSPEEQQAMSGLHGFELGPQPELGSDTEDEDGDDGPSTAGPPAASEAVSPTVPSLNQRDGGFMAAQPASKRGKKLKMTSQGALVPSIPASLIRRIATETALRSGRRRPQLGKDHIKALEQATEWFFEQVGEDLSAYAEHARRKKKIKSSDAETLMRRQRVLEGDGELRQLAEHFLPEKVLEELELPDDA